MKHRAKWKRSRGVRNSRREGGLWVAGRRNEVGEPSCLVFVFLSDSKHVPADGVQQQNEISFIMYECETETQRPRAREVLDASGAERDVVDIVLVVASAKQ